MTPTLDELRAQAEQARAGLLFRAEDAWDNDATVAWVVDRLKDLAGALAQAEQHTQTSAIGLADGPWCPGCGNDAPCPDYQRAADLLGRLARRYSGTP